MRLFGKFAAQENAGCGSLTRLHYAWLNIRLLFQQQSLEVSRVMHHVAQTHNLCENHAVLALHGSLDKGR